MNILKLMPNQYSMFHTTIPQGKVVSVDIGSGSIQTGKVIEELTIMNDHIIPGIRKIDSSKQKESFVILKAMKIRKLTLFMPKNTEQSIMFTLKSNGVSIQDIALVRPIFLSSAFNNIWTLPRMFNLFQGAFNYYEVEFPFYLYCNENDILELYTQNNICANRLPAYNVSYNYIDPILVGGDELLYERNIEDLFAVKTQVVILEKVVSDHRYSICFDHKKISLWSTAKESIIASVSCVLSKYNLSDPSISCPDNFKPETCEFIRMVSLLSQDRKSIFTINNILEILHITKASDLIISFVSDVQSIYSEDKRVIFKINISLGETEFLIVKTLYHILYRFADHFIFTFKNKEVEFIKWSY